MQTRIEANIDLWKQGVIEACKDEAAAEMRQQRDVLLIESDAHVALDRFGITLPEEINATSILTALRELVGGLRNIVNGDWAKYRQALRDVPQQEGFPFDVTWPVAPKEK